MLKFSAAILATALLAGTAAAIAAGGGDPPMRNAAPEDPVVEQARAAIARQDWPGAQKILQDALVRNPRSADYHNLYAFSVRKGSNPDMDLVFRHYNEALRIDPKHRNTHEYIGEAYLMVDNLPKAKEHLSALNKLCFLPCEEYDDLKKAVRDYEAKKR